MNKRQWKKKYKVFLKSKIEKIDSNKDDVVVIQELVADYEIRPGLYTEIREVFNQVFPKNKLLIMPYGMELNRVTQKQLKELLDVKFWSGTDL